MRCWRRRISASCRRRACCSCDASSVGRWWRRGSSDSSLRRARCSCETCRQACMTSRSCAFATQLFACLSAALRARQRGRSQGGLRVEFVPSALSPDGTMVHAMPHPVPIGACSCSILEAVGLHSSSSVTLPLHSHSAAGFRCCWPQVRAVSGCRVAATGSSALCLRCVCGAGIGSVSWKRLLEICLPERLAPSASLECAVQRQVKSSPTTAHHLMPVQPAVDQSSPCERICRVKIRTIDSTRRFAPLTTHAHTHTSQRGWCPRLAWTSSGILLSSEAE